MTDEGLAGAYWEELQQYGTKKNAVTPQRKIMKA